MQELTLIGGLFRLKVPLRKLGPWVFSWRAAGTLTADARLAFPCPCPCRGAHPRCSLQVLPRGLPGHSPVGIIVQLPRLSLERRLHSGGGRWSNRVLESKMRPGEASRSVQGLRVHLNLRRSLRMHSLSCTSKSYVTWSSAC